MTTPAVAIRSGGRTSQGRGPAPDPQERGRIQGGASSPGRTRVKRASAQSSAPPRQSRARRQGQAPARPTGGTRRRAEQAARTTRSVAAPSMTDYQKVIAAEFVLAEVLIALTPMTSRKQPTDISPYVPRDMTKMLAVGVVFFLLELLAIPSGWGRPAAWFGAIILLAVGLNEAANVVNDLDALAGIQNAGSKIKDKVGQGLTGRAQAA